MRLNNKRNSNLQIKLSPILAIVFMLTLFPSTLKAQSENDMKKEISSLKIQISNLTHLAVIFQRLLANQQFAILGIQI